MEDSSTNRDSVSNVVKGVEPEKSVVIYWKEYEETFDKGFLQFIAQTKRTKDRRLEAGRYMRMRVGFPEFIQNPRMNGYFAEELLKFLKGFKRSETQENIALYSFTDEKGFFREKNHY